VILAGGRGRRIGGAKALVELGGRPLISYPLAALQRALDQVAVVAKPETELPPLPAGVERWLEPPAPHHPIAGILEGLRRAGGRPVLVCAADLPFVTAATIERLAGAHPGGAAAVIAESDGEISPLLGVYLPRAAERLGVRAAATENRPLRELIAAIEPRTIDVAREELFNVNTAADLALAAAQPNVKS
jgi:molybdopterin-guanine dinucleotide biosynthesis protein A